MSDMPVNSNAKKYEGDGLSFKGKLIGMEDLLVDRDEKICLDSMFKLKAVVRARGEHKQKIQLNLTMSAVKIIDDTTKAQIASHEVERISFVVLDPRDTRAFGYIYNTVDNRHQFWAIKTERTAAASVLALKELFEVAFEYYTNTEKAKLEAKKAPEIPAKPLVTTEEPPSDILDVPEPSPVSAPVVSVAEPFTLDDVFGSNSPTPSTTQTTIPADENLFDITGPSIPVKPPTSTEIDPLMELFGNSETLQPPLAPMNTAPPLLNPFTNFPPPPPRTAQTSLPTATPILPQQPRSAPLPPQQPNYLAPRSLSPVAPPSVTNPFSGFDPLENLSTGTGTKVTKQSFNTHQPPPKTIEQLKMEKQHNPFTCS